MTLTHFWCFLSLLAICDALMCYVCHNQANNKDKCIKTTKQCREHENACMTRILWSQPPFWVPRAERINTLFKDCVDYKQCQAISDAYGKNLTCKRDWFKDWDCYECCRGDLCNYYATLGVSQVSTWIPLLSFSTLAALLNYLYISR